MKKRIIVLLLLLCFVFSASAENFDTKQFTQNRIRIGQTVEGTLSTSDGSGDRGYEDLYTFTASSGQDLEINLTGNFDTYLYVVMPNDNEEYNDDYGSTRRSYISFTAPMSGTYTIRVTSYSPGTTGSYTLTLDGDGGRPEAEREPDNAIRFGQTVSGELTSNDDFGDRGYEDTYQFRANEGDRIELNLTGNFDTYLYLDTREGTVASNDDYGSTRRSYISTTAPSTGNYIVRVTSYSSGTTGSYELTLNGSGDSTTSESSQIEIGQTVSGELTSSDSMGDRGYEDYYTFRAREGQRLNVEVTGDYDTYLFVDMPNGQTEYNDDAGSTRRSFLSFEAPQSGEYTIRISSFSSGETGSYEVRLSESGSASNAETEQLREGRPVTRSLTEDDYHGERGYEDHYEFRLREGQRVTVSVTGDFDTYLFVDFPNGEGEYNDDFGSTSESRVSFVAPESGTYTARVTSYSSGTTGAYEIRYTETENPNAQRISLGSSTQGFLSSSDAVGTRGYVDLYEFQARRGQEVRVNLTGSFDTYLFVEFPDGEERYNDDYGGTRRSYLTFTAPESGTYRVRVTSFSQGSTGGYTLSLNQEQPQGEAESISLGTTIEGNLTNSDFEGSRGYEDTYTFRARRGEDIVVDVTGDFDTYLFVDFPSGELEYNDDTGSVSHSRVSFTAPESGEYTIRVTSYSSDTTGSYVLRLNDEAQVDTRAISMGQSVNGTLESDDYMGERGYEDRYTISLQANQRYEVTLTGDYDTYLFVDFPDGGQEYNDDHGSTRESYVSFTAPTSGTYTIRVTSYSSGTTGRYELIIEEQGRPRGGKQQL
ncbi:MAG: PPC domain-containing protein [Spirochaetia bacterium]